MDQTATAFTKATRVNIVILLRNFMVKRINERFEWNACVTSKVGTLGDDAVR